MKALPFSIPRPSTLATALRFACVGFSLGTAAVAGAQAVPASAAASAAPDLVATGRYLADAAHCAACHTSRADRPYAGNLAISSKFGTMYSTNITPDTATGIGNWTETQFIAALRQGKGQHGEPLYPSMPYNEFTKISDADVHALWAYFRSITPISEKKLANKMKFPFNIRTGVAAWQAVYFKPGRYVDDPSQPAQWNRGAYLVQGLGHCGACHTPRNIAMAEQKKHPLQGAETDHWFAPDISGGRFSGIKDWSEQQVVEYLRSGHNSKNVAAVGPMLQTIAQGTAKLSDGDLQAIAFYLKNQAVVAEGALPKSDSAWNADRRAAGAGVYTGNCQSCHGAEGKGVDGVAPALAGNSSVSSKGPDTVVRAVIQGFAPQGRWGVMPSFNQILDAQEIADVTNYVRTAWGAAAPANATPSLVNKLRFDNVGAERGVQSALICPSAATGQLDADTLREIDALAKKPGSDDAGTAALLARFRGRHPDVAPSDAITALGGAYCRDVMAAGAGSTVARQQRYITFTARLASAGAR